MMDELEKSMKFRGLSKKQLALVEEILKQCYRLVLVNCGYGHMGEVFSVYFNGLQETLKDFSDECYFKAFSLGSDIFMQRMREGQGERKQ